MPLGAEVIGLTGSTGWSTPSDKCATCLCALGVYCWIALQGIGFNVLCGAHIYDTGIVRSPYKYLVPASLFSLTVRDYAAVTIGASVEDDIAMSSIHIRSIVISRQWTGTWRSTYAGLISAFSRASSTSRHLGRRAGKFLVYWQVLHQCDGMINEAS